MSALTDVALARYRDHITSALSHASATHAYEDVAAMVSAGLMTAWPGPASIVVTETIDHPQARLLHFFLASGLRAELEAMTPFILEWGKRRGCTRATLIGRKGWQRTFLAKTGWRTSDLIFMEKDLTDE